MTFLLGASDPHQAAKRAWQPAGEDVQTGQRYSRIERPQSIVRRTHQHGPGLDSRGAATEGSAFGGQQPSVSLLFFFESLWIDRKLFN